MRQMVVGFIICGVVLVGFLVYIAVKRVLTGRNEKGEPWEP